MDAWKTFEKESKVIAISNFKKEDHIFLNLKIGDILDIIEETNDWFRGFKTNNPKKKGIFPKSFVRLFENRELERKDKTVIEIEEVLKEWTTIWLEKFDDIEHQKKNHCLMGYFKNALNLKNVIVENRASIDEINDLKKSNLGKILQGNNILGLDVFAFDSNYNRLDSKEATTLFLYEELKKNNEISNLSLQSCSFYANSSKEEYANDSFLQKFEHKPTTVSHINYAKSSSNYCLKVSLESIISSSNVQFSFENTDLCVNIFLYKESSPENSFYLCENAIFQMTDLKNNIHSSTNVYQKLSFIDSNEKYVFFCDLSEKDFEYTKKGYKLLLVAYSIKHTRHNEKDLLTSMSKKITGGLYDLGSNLCNLVFVSADIRNFQASMILYVSEFDSSIVCAKNILDYLNIKEISETKNSRLNKETFLNLTFRIELFEISFKHLINKFGHLNPKICRKMDFPEIIMPDDFRNEFFITLIGGDFQKVRNYEFIVNVVRLNDENDAKTEEPISFNENIDQNCTKNFFYYKSIVYLKQDKPRWNEIVKINIPLGKKIKDLKRLYIRILIRSRPQDAKEKNKLIGVSYLQITNENGSAIKDLHCFLPIHKIECEVEHHPINGCFIPLKFQYFANNYWQNNPDKLKEFLELKVKVVSTQLTQNVTLLNLLSFPTYEPLNENNYQCLLSYLDELSSLKEEQTAEIVKFLQAILDKLIDILLDLNNKNENISEKTIEFHRKFIQPRVFEILVFIFQMIENQTKYASFRSVIDTYLEKSFCITLVHKPILRIFYNLLKASYEKYNSTIRTHVDEKDNFETKLKDKEEFFNQKSAKTNSIIESDINDDKDQLTLNAIKSVEFIFKFAFRSRELLSIYNKSSYVNTKEENFDEMIENVFEHLVVFCKLNAKVGSNSRILQIQTYILKNVVNLIPILICSNRYSIEFITEQYVEFFQNPCIFKTNFFSSILETKLFKFSNCRKILLEPICNVLIKSLSFKNEIQLLNSNHDIEFLGKLTAQLINVLEINKIESIKEEVNQITTLIPCLSAIFLYFNDNILLKQLYGTNIIAIMRLMNSDSVDMLLYSSNMFESIYDFVDNCSSCIERIVYKYLIQQKEITKEMKISQLKMLKLIYLCNILMIEEIFPKNWYELIILRNEVVFHFLKKVSEKLLNNYLENFDSINKIIWTDYFNCLVLLSTDHCLERKKFTKSEIRKEKNEDLRIQIAREIRRMWFNLGDKKFFFIPDLVSSFTKVSLLPLYEIQCATIPLIFDMINCEYMKKGSTVCFDDLLVPNLLITTLDEQLEIGKRDLTFRNSFEKIMHDKFSAHSHLNKHKGFVQNVVNLFDLLLEYSEIKKESSDTIKTYYLNEILCFYRNLKRYDIYVKYIEKLRKIHIISKNLVCAANTLKLHAELLYWTNDPLEKHLIHECFPNENIHKNLKELLFIQLINDYTYGQAWEKAFEFSKILRGIYESEFSFDKLYGFLRKQSELCENIIKINRFECKYFLVGFYGKKFPKFFQNKRFVFRSEPLEQIITFRQRVESWFPNSIRISHSYTVTKHETDSFNRFIQVISVNPIYEENDAFKTLKVSPMLTKYYEHNEIKKFKYSYRKDSVLNEDDPTLWWLVEKYVTISNQLPDVINFYEITEEKTIDISPIQNAINIVSERLLKLKEAVSKIEFNNQVNETDKLLIQGTIDPGVSGGLPKYKKFFLNNSKIEDSKKNAFLKELINETILWGEALLESSLTFLPSDHLLNIIKNEQLPKLKKLFDIPNKKYLVDEQENNDKLESTPKILTRTQNNSEQNNLNKSFLNKVQENYTGRTILSYFGVCDKPNSSNFSIISNNSQRDSISSIKSLNSDEDFNNRKIILDETISSKRPLRRFQNLNFSSTSNSNRSSRPISNISGEDINLNPSFQNFDPNDANRLDKLNEMAPPKPPKNKIIQVKTNEFLDKNIFCETNENDQSKSTTSLHSFPIKSLFSKTNSDSILNKE